VSPDTEPADHAVLMLQQTRDLLLECRAVAQRPQVAVEQESQAGAAERIAYGVLVAASKRFWVHEGLAPLGRPCEWVGVSACSGCSPWQASATGSLVYLFVWAARTWSHVRPMT